MNLRRYNIEKMLEALVGILNRPCEYIYLTIVRLLTTRQYRNSEETE